MEALAPREQLSDNGGRVELADGDEPINSTEEAAVEEVEPVKSLTQRMIAIRKEASGIAKEKIKMGNFDMDAHTIEGVLHGVRALFDKHGVWMQPNLVERVYNGNRCDVIFDFYFENVDDGEDRKVVRFAGAGNDNSDKAYAKAATNALKEMLKKVFLITDREDDKEETETVEHRSEGSGDRVAMERAEAGERAAIEKWATAFRAALKNAQSVDDVKRLEREHKEQLASKHTPSATREFFVELIEKQKEALK